MVLVKTHPGDLAVEALRSLRTSLQLALAAGRSNVVAVMGPSPSVGKTFVSVNLAHLLADAGSRVLLVDADLRKGMLHRQLGKPRSPGLSEILQGDEHVYDVECVTPHLHFVACGEAPANPSELLSTRRLDQFLEAVSPDFDVVIVDTAPVLAVTDGVLAGRRAGTTLLVLRAGQHPLREITGALKQMAQNGVEPCALVINGMRAQAADYSNVKYGRSYQSSPRSRAQPPSRRA
jgi:tyrosine-protein kinase Etk/Wzc